MPDVLDGMLLAILVVGISGWAYGRVQAIMAAVDETPWSMDKTKEELDWSLRNEYIQKAAEPNATLAKLKPKLLERCMHAIQLYVVCQDEQKDFSKVEHLLSTSVKDQTIRKFMEVTGEMEAIEAEANRLKPGWGETIFQEASEGIRAKRQQEQENMNRKRLEEQQKAFLEQARVSGEELVEVQPMVQTPEGPRPAGPPMKVPKSMLAQMNVQGGHGHSHDGKPCQGH